MIGQNIQIEYKDFVHFQIMHKIKSWDNVFFILVLEILEKRVIILFFLVLVLFQKIIELILIHRLEDIVT